METKTPVVPTDPQARATLLDEHLEAGESALLADARSLMSFVECCHGRPEGEMRVVVLEADAEALPAWARGGWAILHEADGEVEIDSVFVAGEERDVQERFWLLASEAAIREGA